MERKTKEMPSRNALVIILLSAVSVILLFLTWAKTGYSNSFIKGNVKIIDIIEACGEYTDWAGSVSGFHSAYFSGMSDAEKIELLESLYKQFNLLGSAMELSLIVCIVAYIAGSILLLLKKKLGGIFCLIGGSAGMALFFLTSSFVSVAGIDGSPTLAYYLFFVLSIIVFILSVRNIVLFRKVS